MNKITKIPAPSYPKEPTQEGPVPHNHARAKQAAGELWESFAWSQSAEGFDFWNGIHNRLLAIAKGEPLR